MASTYKNLFCGCLVVAPLVHLVLIFLTLKQIKLINNPLYCLTDQIKITAQSTPT